MNSLRKFFRRKNRNTGTWHIINLRTIDSFTAGEIIDMLKPEDHWSDMMKRLESR